MVAESIKKFNGYRENMLNFPLSARFVETSIVIYPTQQKRA